MELLENIFGTGKDLEIYQMCARAFVTFFIALFLIRLAGMRSFGKKSAVDNVIIIVLGAVLSRAIVGVSPYLSTVAACTVIVITHRVIAFASIKNPWLEKIVKGEQRVLYKSNEINWPNMKRSCVSERDLLESVRLKSGMAALTDIEEAHIESNGQISIITKSKYSEPEEIQR
jgi:uncharacterized membrane protein YcaP (DUF421 family)